MTDAPLDPNREQMIAALYGELAPEEMEAFLAHLKKDPELEKEWDELQGTRAFLQKADAETETAGFSFLMPAAEAAAQRPPAAQAPAAQAPQRGASQAGLSWRAGWQRLLLSPATGFAAVALTLAVLMIAGLRVDRVAGALVIGFDSAPAISGAPPTEGAQAEASRTRSMGTAITGGIPLESGMTAGGQTGHGELAPQTVSAEQAAALGGYVTRADLAVFAEQLMRMTEEQLLDARQRTRGEFVYLLNEFNESMGDQQRREQARRDAQLEEIWLGVVGMMAAGGNSAFQGQSANPRDVRVSPVHQVAPGQEEGRSNE